jgi:methylamine dehydrogenase accessory protein MauD
MPEALYVSQAVLWIVVAVLAAMVLALARQVGVLHERVAPMGALMIDRGPRVGEKAPIFELPDLARRAVKVGAPNPDGRSTLLMFVSPTCPVCKKLFPIVKSIAQDEARWLDVVFASDGEEAEQRRLVRASRLESFPLLLSRELGMTYQIGKLPYVVLIDEEGVVRAKGLVNTREHLESVLEAKQMRVASLNEYLESRHDHGAAGAVLSNGERGGKQHGNG